MKKILKFYTPTCAPCKALSATLKKMNLPIPIEEIDATVRTDLVNAYGVIAVPTLVLIDGNEYKGSLCGAVQENQIHAFLADYA